MIWRHALTTLAIAGLVGCVTLGTENPDNPEADNPIVEGDEAMPPLGCLLWQGREPDADC